MDLAKSTSISEQTRTRLLVHAVTAIGLVAAYVLARSMQINAAAFILASSQSFAVVSGLLVGLLAAVRFAIHKNASLSFIAHGLIVSVIAESIVLAFQWSPGVSGLSKELQTLGQWITEIEPSIFPLIINLSWVSHLARLSQQRVFEKEENPTILIIGGVILVWVVLSILFWTGATESWGLDLSVSSIIAIALYGSAYVGLSVIARWRQGPVDTQLLTALVLLIFARVLLFANTDTQNLTIVIGYVLKVIAKLLLFAAIITSTRSLIQALRSIKDKGALLERRRLLKVLDEQKVELQAKSKELEEQKMALVNVLEDITQEKELEHTQSESLLGIIGEGIVITDSHGVITYINEAAQELTGFSHSDLAGKDFADTIKMFDLKQQPIPPVERSDSAAITAKGSERKVLLGTKDDRQIAVSINATAINFLGEYRGVIRVLHDFSQDLELQQQKDDFFSIASHELRTPLTVIGGNVDMLLQGFGDSQLSQEDTELLQDTATATERLIRMVNSFLDVSRLDQGRLKLTSTQVNIQELSKQVVEEMQVLAQQNNIQLSYACHTDKVMVTGDQDKLREVLVNLIGNSLKFTKEGSITVKHGADDKTIYLSVIDTGAGIEKDKQGLLFQRFQQAMSRTLAREAGGTGLGLYISREFVRRMGGDLVLVNSKPGVMTEFMITLPIAGMALHTTPASDMQ